MTAINLPVALDSALQSLIAQCQLLSWDVHGKGNFTTVIIRFNSESDAAMSVEQPRARAVSCRSKSPSEMKCDRQRTIARQPHAQQKGDTAGSNRSDANDKKETANMADPKSVPFISPPCKVNTIASDEDNATESENDDDRQFSDCDQNLELCGTDLSEASDPSVVTLPDNTEESQAILEEWERGRVATLVIFLESLGSDVFNRVLLSASRTGPVLKKTVLDHRYGHYALLGLTEDFVFEYSLHTETVSEYFLVKIFHEPGSSTAETLDCIHRWWEADKFQYASQISRLKAHVCACYSVISRLADNVTCVQSEPEQEDAGRELSDSSNE